MSEKQAERRSGDERRKAARRGTGPDLSVEQVFDGELDQPAGQAYQGEDKRLMEQRFEIRRQEDRELHDFLSVTGTA